MRTKSPKTDATLAASSVAPEDLRRGDFVAVHSELIELPSFLWCDVAPSEREDLVRMRFRPRSGGMPLAVKAICLPFVFVKSPLGERHTIDVRQVQLVRLKRRYAKAVWRALRRQRKHAKKREKNGT
jgi:hypothetical protein